MRHCITSAETCLYMDASGERPCGEPPSWLEEVLQFDKNGTVRGLGKPLGDGAFGKVYLLDAADSVGEVNVADVNTSSLRPAQVCHLILQGLSLLNRDEVNSQRKAILKIMPKTPETKKDASKKNAVLRRECYILHLVSDNEIEYRNEYGTSLNPLFYGCFESKDHIYIFMEVGPSRTLASVDLDIDIGGNADVEGSENKIAMILVKVLLALRRNLITVSNQVRQNPIIHRDVKLDNVLLDSESQKLMLVDWGSAAVLSPPASYVGQTMDNSEQRQQLEAMTSISSDIQGTHAYMAPEVLASEGLYLKALIQEESSVKECLRQDLLKELENGDRKSCYSFEADIWSVAVTLFLLQYGQRTQDNSPFAPPEWDINSEEDFETYSAKTILHSMLTPSESLQKAPESSGTRFREAEQTSLLPSLLRAMLRPNTKTFKFVKSGNVLDADSMRLSPEAVLQHQFCQAALGSDQRIQREVDVVLSRKNDRKRSFATMSEDVHEIAADAKHRKTSPPETAICTKEASSGAEHPESGLKSSKSRSKKVRFATIKRPSCSAKPSRRVKKRPAKAKAKRKARP